MLHAKNGTLAAAIKADPKRTATIGRDHLVSGVETQVMRITPSEAGSLLSSCRYDRQRDLRAWWIKALAEMMKRGEFYEGTQLKFGEIPGVAEWVLLDGQHRLHAIVASGISAVFTVTVCKFRSLEDAWKVYYTTDTGLARSITDTYPDLADVLGTSAGKYGGAAAAAAVMIATHFQGRFTGRGGPEFAYVTKSKEFRVRCVRQWAPDYRGYFDALRVPGRDREVEQACLRAPVVAVGAVTMHWQRDRANEFWTSIVTNGALERTDPRRTLVEALINTRGRTVQSFSLARLVASCWGYWFNNAPVGARLGPGVYDPSRPIEIEGTPYRRMSARPTEVAIVPTQEEFDGRMVIPMGTKQEAIARAAMEPMEMGIVAGGEK